VENLDNLLQLKRNFAVLNGSLTYSCGQNGEDRLILSEETPLPARTSAHPANSPVLVHFNDGKEKLLLCQVMFPEVIIINHSEVINLIVCFFQLDLEDSSKLSLHASVKADLSLNLSLMDKQSGKSTQRTIITTGQ